MGGTGGGGAAGGGIGGGGLQGGPVPAFNPVNKNFQQNIAQQMNPLNPGTSAGPPSAPPTTGGASYGQPIFAQNQPLPPSTGGQGPQTQNQNQQVNVQPQSQFGNQAPPPPGQQPNMPFNAGQQMPGAQGPGQPAMMSPQTGGMAPPTPAQGAPQMQPTAWGALGGQQVNQGMSGGQPNMPFNPGQMMPGTTGGMGQNQFPGMGGANQWGGNAMMLPQFQGQPAGMAPQPMPTSTPQGGNQAWYQLPMQGMGGQGTNQQQSQQPFPGNTVNAATQSTNPPLNPVGGQKQK